MATRNGTAASPQSRPRRHPATAGVTAGNRAGVSAPRCAVRSDVTVLLLPASQSRMHCVGFAEAAREARTSRYNAMRSADAASLVMLRRKGADRPDGPPHGKTRVGLIVRSRKQGKPNSKLRPDAQQNGRVQTKARPAPSLFPYFSCGKTGIDADRAANDHPRGTCRRRNGGLSIPRPKPRMGSACRPIP